MVSDKSILYSCEESDRINRLIQTKIAPHLFLTCNYAPSPYYIESEDAKFVVGILNLYKFAVDGSVINKIPDIMDDNMSHTIDVKSFKKNIDIVKALRSSYGHNESEISGNDDDVKKVDAWMQKRPQTTNDYIALNQRLQKLAADIVDVVHQFVIEASRSKQKTFLIERWENIIGDFYQRPNTKNILVGQLKKFYSARKGILSMERSDNRDMACCVRTYYIGDLESKRDEREEHYRICRNLSLSTENQAKLKKKVEEVEEKLTERKNQIIMRLGSGGTTIDKLDRNVYLYLDLYMKELPQKIIDLIKNAEDTDAYETLLPQNIVQYIVKQDFDLIIRK